MCANNKHSMYLSRVTKSTSPFKYVVPEKNMFMINEYWRMYYVLGILCIYSSTSFVKKQKSKTDMPNSNEFDEYRLLPKICDWAKYQNRHSSKSIRVTKLSFCQSDSPMSESFWQRSSLVTHIFFDLCLFKHCSPVANFGQQSLVKVRSI